MTEPQPSDPSAGRVEWIGLSSHSRAPLQPVPQAALETGAGLTGDHHAKRRPTHRQVTLIDSGHLLSVAALLGRAKVDPERLRRNLVVSGVNLADYQNRRFRIGPVLLEGSGPCEPCPRMDEELGPGGLNAMQGYGGICARVIEGGRIELGDRLVPADGD